MLRLARAVPTELTLGGARIFKVIKSDIVAHSPHQRDARVTICCRVRGRRPVDRLVDPLDIAIAGRALRRKSGPNVDGEGSGSDGGHRVVRESEGGQSAGGGIDANCFTDGKAARRDIRMGHHHIAGGAVISIGAGAACRRRHSQGLLLAIDPQLCRVFAIYYEGVLFRILREHLARPTHGESIRNDQRIRRPGSPDAVVGRGDRGIHGNASRPAGEGRVCVNTAQHPGGGAGSIVHKASAGAGCGKARAGDWNGEAGRAGHR